MRLASLVSTAALLFATIGLVQSADAPGKPPMGPLSPREAQGSLRVLPGFKVELVACEPEIVDPVALAFDEDGRLYVAEMRGYPNGGVGTGNIASGKIKLLEDKDGDGFYETSRTFAEGLRFPTSVMPHRGGLLAAVAPDLLYFDGPDADGKAKGKRVLYTGFDVANIQQLLSGLQWGLDNWVYGCAGSKGGDITSKEKPDAPAVTLRGRGIRFHPDKPGSLEPTSGGGQFGLAADDGQHWFTATNSQHLRQIVLPDHYLRRNPNLAVPAVTLDIPDHGAACKVHRISPFEAWRVERTTKRAGGADAKRFSATELVPGGFITSGTSPVIYNGGLFPAKYHGNSFVCDPANNLIHRDLLADQGSTFVAQRADENCEFLASTDVWFRPVAQAIGPDGAIYVADFYREAIETPLSLPEEIKAKMNLESRGRGRIWRIVPEDYKRPALPQLSKATADELVRELASANSWRRLTAQRLLVERQAKAAAPALHKLAAGENPVASVHALWTLDALGALEAAEVERALQSKHMGVVEQALRLAEPRLAASPALRKAVTGLAASDDKRIRFQLALSLGADDSPEARTALAALAKRDAGNPWFATAILSSSAGARGPELLASLKGDADLPFLTRLAATIGAGGGNRDLAQVFSMLDSAQVAPWQLAVLEGVGQGLQQGGRPLRTIWDNPPAELKEAVAKARPFFARAATSAADEQKPLAERTAAVRLLGIGPFAAGLATWPALLSPRQPAEVQSAAVRALAAQDQPQVAELLVAGWGSYSPTLRREVTEALLARPDRVRALLDAVEQKKIQPGQIESARVEQLKKHPDAALRQRVQKLFAGVAVSDRQKTIDDYRAALTLKGDAAKGKLVFKKVCSVCHKLENEGFEVGADLLAALKTKTPEALLVDVLDPSREVDPRFLNYVVATKDGRVLTGMIAVESPASLTLRRAEKSEDTILRSQIEDVQATSKSLMPDELEKQLAKQDLADVIAYLQSVVGK